MSLLIHTQLLAFLETIEYIPTPVFCLYLRQKKFPWSQTINYLTS